MNQKQRRLAVLSGVFVVSVTVGGAGTFALWEDRRPSASSELNAGNLDVAAATSNQLSWVETSADVFGTPKTIADPSRFLVRQGDTFEVSYRFTSTIQGDNMLAGLSIGWPETGQTGAVSLPAGVTGTYRLFTVPVSGDPIEVVAATPIGSAPTTPITPIATNDVGRADAYRLDITLDFAGLSDRFGAQSPVQTADLGAFTVTLDQLRTGDGFQ